MTEISQSPQWEGTDKSTVRGVLDVVRGGSGYRRSPWGGANSFLHRDLEDESRHLGKRREIRV